MLAESKYEKPLPGSVTVTNVRPLVEGVVFLDENGVRTWGREFDGNPRLVSNEESRRMDLAMRVKKKWWERNDWIVEHWHELHDVFSWKNRHVAVRISENFLFREPGMKHGDIVKDDARTLVFSWNKLWRYTIRDSGKTIGLSPDGRNLVAKKGKRFFYYRDGNLRDEGPAIGSVIAWSDDGNYLLAGNKRATLYSYKHKRILVDRMSMGWEGKFAKVNYEIYNDGKGLKVLKKGTDEVLSLYKLKWDRDERYYKYPDTLKVQ